MEVDRKQFEDAVRKLIATPPLPKASIARKRSRKVRQKAKPATPPVPAPTQR